MNSKKFEGIVEEHSLKPLNLLYNSVGLSGEVGEVANIIKKLEIRKTLPESEIKSIKTVRDYREMMKDELGDCLFYLTRLIMDNGLTLEEVMEDQTIKLEQQNHDFNKLFLK